MGANVFPNCFVYRIVDGRAREKIRNQRAKIKMTVENVKMGKIRAWNTQEACSSGSPPGSRVGAQGKFPGCWPG